MQEKIERFARMSIRCNKLSILAAYSDDKIIGYEERNSQPPPTVRDNKQNLTLLQWSLKK